MDEVQCEYSAMNKLILKEENESAQAQCKCRMSTRVFIVFEIDNRESVPCSQAPQSRVRAHAKCVSPCPISFWEMKFYRNQFPPTGDIRAPQSAYTYWYYFVDSSVAVCTNSRKPPNRYSIMTIFRETRNRYSVFMCTLSTQLSWNQQNKTKFNKCFWRTGCAIQQTAVACR